MQQLVVVCKESRVLPAASQLGSAGLPAAAGEHLHHVRSGTTGQAGHGKPVLANWDAAVKEAVGTDGGVEVLHGDAQEGTVPHHQLGQLNLAHGRPRPTWGSQQTAWPTGTQSGFSGP